MKPRSSTSASRSRPHTYALVFFGTMFLLFMFMNMGVTAFYLGMRGSTKGGEWYQKQEFFEKAAATSPPDYLFLGDSTVSCGFRPSRMSVAAFNLARSGMDPSELGSVVDLIDRKGVAPRIVFLSFIPGFMSQNDWKNGFAVPYGVALGDAMAQFYEDSNSMKPMLLFGNGTLTRFFENHLVRFEKKRNSRNETWWIDVDGAQVFGQVTVRPIGTLPTPKLRLRLANFSMLQQVKDRLSARGTRVVWVYLPYRSDFQKSLETNPNAANFYREYQSRIGQIFQQDIVDLRGVLPDSGFKDGAHMLPEGADQLSRTMDKIVKDRFNSIAVSGVPRTQ